LIDRRFAEMEHPAATPPLPAEYYRRHAARVRRLAGEATTPAIKEHLREVAVEYERLAERVDSGISSADG
jgi:hypothetical protein